MADETNIEATPKQSREKTKPELPHCGVIMPISGTIDYPTTHWADMLQLIQEAAKEAQFTCEIVSSTGRDDIIHSSIVNNIYQNELVVCDVSSRNPNVMLELGLRLASKLPIVIIFDGEGNYPFDIGTIRYLGYRKDMRYYDTNKFKKDLSAKILEVYDTYKNGQYKSFLSHFKNVDLNLDSIRTETQSITQFLGNLDKRLSKFETQNISLNKTERLSLANATREQIVGILNPYMSKLQFNKVIIAGDGRLSPEMTKKAFEAISSDEYHPLNQLRTSVLMNYIQDWDGLPF